MRSGIYIDDTGNAGNNTESIYDSPLRKSWLALILTPEEREHADLKMRELIELLKEDFGADEFHFKDIYNGQGQFKGVSLNKRTAIFEHFASIFAQMNYPMLIQTMTAEDLTRNKLIYSDLKIKSDNFKLGEPSDFALFFLLFRIKSYLASQSGCPVPVDIIIDEGRQKPDTTQKIELFGDMLHNKEVQYKSSHKEPLLQLVDYAAFCLNRGRWILSHREKKSLDKQMLQIFARANFNVLNLVKQVIDINADTVAHYDEVLASTYAKHSHMGNLDIAEMIKSFYK